MWRLAREVVQGGALRRTLKRGEGLRNMSVVWLTRGFCKSHLGHCTVPLPDEPASKPCQWRQVLTCVSDGYSTRALYIFPYLRKKTPPWPSVIGSFVNDFKDVCKRMRMMTCLYNYRSLTTEASSSSKGCTTRSVNDPGVVMAHWMSLNERTKNRHVFSAKDSSRSANKKVCLWTASAFPHQGSSHGNTDHHMPDKIAFCNMIPIEIRIFWPISYLLMRRWPYIYLATLNLIQLYVTRLVASSCQRMAWNTYYILVT